MYQPKNAFNKIQFTTNIKILHVSALEFHPQGVLRRTKEYNLT